MGIRMKHPRIFIVVIIISFILFVSSSSSQAVPSISPIDNTNHASADFSNQLADITTNTAIITQKYYLSDQYAVYGQPSSIIVVEAEIYIISQPGDNPILSIPYFGPLKAIRCPSYVSYEYGIDVWGHKALEFKIPMTTKYVKISVEYNEENLLSIMYRNYMKLYYSTTTVEFTRFKNFTPIYRYYISFFLPADAEFLYGFPWMNGQTRNLITSQTEQEIVFRLDPSFYLHIAYQSKKLKIYSTLLSFPALLIVPFMFASMPQRFFRSKIRKLTRSRIYKKVSYLIRQVHPMRFAVALYVLTVMLMLSLAISVGPNPDATIVIIADNFDGIANRIHERYPQANTFQYWSVRARLNQLRDVKQIDVFVVGNYPNPAQFIVDDVLLSSELGVQVIIIEENINTPLATAILTEYNEGRGENLKIVPLDSVAGRLSSIYNARQQLHRIYTPSSNLFATSCAIIAFLSLLHIYAAGMVVTASATPPPTKSITEVFLQAIIATFAVFSFTMISLFSVGKLLTVVASVHGASGVVDGYPLTVIGYLPSLPPPFPSFGGGNILRAAFGAMGVITIILINHNKGIIKLDLTLFVCLLGGGAVLAVSPYFGPFIVGLAVVFVTSGIGPVTGAPRVLAADISLFLLTFGRFTALGEYSRGIMLFFASVIPLTITRKLLRRVRTPVYILMIPIVARGLMRLGEMNPYTLINSAIPGLLFGIALAAIFLILNAGVYAFFRASIRFRQWMRSLQK